MLQFLNPIWFFAAAAIIIPVIIHLWNIKPGKVLKVGSTALITAASRKSSRSFKLLDIPLLLLRCLLLLLLAFLLAFPVLEQHIKVVKAKGWVMLPKEDFSAGYTKYKTSVDSLLKLGYEFHYFNSGLPKADLLKLLAGRTDISKLDTALTQPANYWSLISEADNKAPSDVPVYVYTTATISHFAGNKPAVNIDLHWKTFNTKDTVSKWIQDAWLTNSKVVRVVKGIGKPSGTSFQYVNIQSDKGGPQFKLTVDNGQAKVNLTGSKNAPITVDTSVIKIGIYTDHYQADAGYLKAALDASGQFSQRKIVIKQYTSPALIPVDQNWLFWLSDQVVPDRFLQQPAKIFAYESGKQGAITSWISTDDQFAAPSGMVQVPLFKLTNTSRNFTKILWHDGFGHPILAKESRKKSTYFHFFTRFNPTWNDLVWDSSFPKVILKLIADTPEKYIADHDRRIISVDQILPLKTNEIHAVAAKFIMKKELDIYFWLALVLVFFLERWLATRTKMINKWLSKQELTR